VYEFDRINPSISDLAFMNERWLLSQLRSKLALGEFGGGSPSPQ
jgi:hypothetical protein